MSQGKIEKKWFVIHTYSGHEKKVKTDLDKRVETLGLNEKVFRIIVPEEETIEIRRGKKKKVARKLFPGYVMIEMAAEKEEAFTGISYKVDSDAWYVIRNTAGVTGFVGIGADPSPLEEDEVSNIFRKIGMAEEKKPIKIDLGFSVGARVKIAEGAFEDSEGNVSDINFEHRKVKVMIDLFGRLTPVEVSFEGVEKL